MSDKIPVGISACLLGDAVRFDGGHKRLAFAADELAPWVRFEPVCPEMAIGLPTPRPALRLVKVEDDELQLRFSDGREGDLTDAMRDFTRQRIARFEHLCGYIVCAKSPSCGMERVRVYEPEGKNNRKAGRGIYTRLLMDSVPRVGGELGEAPANTELPGNRRLPEGCYFRDRCPWATEGCDKPQALRPQPDGTLVRCWRTEAIAPCA